MHQIFFSADAEMSNLTTCHLSGNHKPVVFFLHTMTYESFASKVM